VWTMSAIRTCSCNAFVLITWLGIQSVGAAVPTDTLARAKDLYLAAAYDEALAVLDSLDSEVKNGEAAEIAQYRVFCLLALGRRDDAQKAIEGIVNADPFYRPTDSQTSPRIQNVFQDIRRSVLPSVVQRSYAEAKEAFEKKDPSAAAKFDRVIALLDDPDVKSNGAMADLRTVASGFRDLSKAVGSAPPPAPPAPERTEPAPSAVPTALAPAPAAKTGAAKAAETKAAEPAIARDGDPGVIGPATISQPLPAWNPLRMDEKQREYAGTIEITIDEKGSVVGAVIRESVHPLYDNQLVRMARLWKYKPATRDGVPTKYVKMVEVQLRPPGVK
jgi:TonB family protein